MILTIFIKILENATEIMNAKYGLHLMIRLPTCLCTAKPYCFLVNDTILVSDNPLSFRRNILEII